MNRLYLEELISYFRKQLVNESSPKIREGLENLIKYLYEVLKCLK